MGIDAPVHHVESSAEPGASVVTIVRGRQDHLANLVVGLGRQEAPPRELVVVQMGGPNPSPALLGWRGPIEIVEMVVPENDPLPLAAARNRGAAAASGDHLVFLDVDCIPGASLVRALEEHLEPGGRVGAAQVRYLAPGALGTTWTKADLDLGVFHPVRPEVTTDTTLAPELLWSLAIGLAREDFDLLGGFDETYVGYGAEDTDFGLRAAGAGLDLSTVSDAVAYHQHHDTHEPPLQHLHDVVANARRFHDRWGRWPMEGWLAAMTGLGLVAWVPGGATLEVIRDPTADELELARR